MAPAGTPSTSRHGAPARCPRSRSMAQGASPSVASGRFPMFRRCCSHPLHLAGLQAYRRVIAGLLAVPGTAGVHQGWLPFQHPLAPQLRVSPEMGLVSEEYLAASALRLVPQGAVLRHEGLPLGFVCLEQPLLGPLEGKPQPVQAIQTTAAAYPESTDGQGWTG